MGEEEECQTRSGVQWRIILSFGGLSGVSSFFLFRSKKFKDLIGNQEPINQRESILLSTVTGISFGLIAGAIERSLSGC